MQLFKEIIEKEEYDAKFKDKHDDTTDNSRYAHNLSILLKKFFSNNGKLYKRNVVIPLENNKLETKIKQSDLEVIDYLNSIGYITTKESYILGTCTNSNNKVVSIKDALLKISNINIEKKQDTLNKIKDQNIIEKIKKEIEEKEKFKIEYLKSAILFFKNINEYSVVFTWVPRKIASQSTKVGWTSCMDLFSGSNSRYIWSSMKTGAFIAWLVKTGDEFKLEKPLARILIKPYVSAPPVESYWIAASKIYTDRGEEERGILSKFKSRVKEFLAEKQQNVKGTYYYNQENYKDEGEPGSFEISEKYTNIEKYIQACEIKNQPVKYIVLKKLLTEKTKTSADFWYYILNNIDNKRKLVNLIKELKLHQVFYYLITAEFIADLNITSDSYDKKQLDYYFYCYDAYESLENKPSHFPDVRDQLDVLEVIKVALQNNNVVVLKKIIDKIKKITFIPIRELVRIICSNTTKLSTFKIFYETLQLNKEHYTDLVNKILTQLNTTVSLQLTINKEIFYFLLEDKEIKKSYSIKDLETFYSASLAMGVNLEMISAKIKELQELQQKGKLNKEDVDFIYYNVDLNGILIKRDLNKNLEIIKIYRDLIKLAFDTFVFYKAIESVYIARFIDNLEACYYGLFKDLGPDGTSKESDYIAIFLKAKKFNNIFLEILKHAVKVLDDRDKLDPFLNSKIKGFEYAEKSLDSMLSENTDRSFYHILYKDSNYSMGKKYFVQTLQDYKDTIIGYIKGVL